MVRYHQPTANTQHRPPSWSALRRKRLRAAESHLRQAARLMELDPAEDWQRLSKIVLRLAQRIAVDSGRLEAA
jgi:hypothetical protein